MSYFEYLEILQKKYGTSNTELLRAMEKTGHPISKSNLTHKLKGQRRLTAEELEVIIQTICPTGTEESKLRSLYRIWQFGEDKYFAVETIRDHLTQLSDRITVNFPPLGEPLSEISVIRRESLLHQVLYAVMQSAWGKQLIRIRCTAHFQRLIDALMTLSTESAPVRHLICLNNESGGKQQIYNTHCLFTAAGPAWQNREYAVRFYYDSAESCTGFYTVYPFFIVTDEHLLLIAHDCRSGLLLHDAAARRSYADEFDRVYDAADTLWKRSEGWLDCFRECAEQEKKCDEQFFYLQNSVGLLLAMDPPLMEKYLRPELPFRKELIALQKKRIAERRRELHGCLLYVSDTIQDLKERGEIQPELASILLPMAEADRQRAADRLNDAYCVNRMLRRESLPVPEKVSVQCYDNGTVVLRRRGNEPVSLLIRERKLYTSVKNFFEYLIQYAAEKE
ncbi:MAG: hypothetical protein MJ065_09620 [Oscillospiraceae bacterium]|nr:hypothetical protein [Oscillospiraceae bacterium]